MSVRTAAAAQEGRRLSVAESPRAAKPKPVRAGDVFRFDRTRWATVMEVLPGGRAQLRISGYRDGKPSLRIGEARVCDVKTWERAGRADYADGAYLALDHDALLAAVGEAP